MPPAFTHALLRALVVGMLIPAGVLSIRLSLESSSLLRATTTTNLVSDDDVAIQATTPWIKAHDDDDEVFHLGGYEERDLATSNSTKCVASNSAFSCLSSGKSIFPACPNNLLEPLPNKWCQFGNGSSVCCGNVEDCCEVTKKARNWFIVAGIVLLLSCLCCCYCCFCR